MRITATSRWLVVCLVVVGVLSDASAREPRRPRMDRLFQMLDALIDAPRLDRQTVEQTLGVQLDESHRYSSADPKEYTGRNARADDIAVSSILFQDGPVRMINGEMRNSGVWLTISSGCIKSADVRGHYQDIDYLLIIGSHVGYVGTELYRHGPWGDLFFHSEYGCLCDVTLWRMGQSTE